MTDATGLTTANDRLVVTLDPGGPIEITGLSASLAALARIYDRHHRQDLGDVAPKLYIARLRTGSIIAEIVPLLFLIGQVVPYAEGAMVIADFTRRVGMGLRAFARRQSPPPTSPKRTGGT